MWALVVFVAAVILVPAAVYGGMRKANVRKKPAAVAAGAVFAVLFAIAVIFGKEIVSWFEDDWDCIAAGTPIATPTGPRAIESLAPGDAVLAFADGAYVVARVTAVRSASVDSVLLITLPDRVVEATGAHPFSTPEGWRRAERLAPGDRVRTGADWIEVESVSRKSGTRVVYDLTVAPCHNFFANGVLVHNKVTGTPERE